jgi:regulator of protease activity HflC (stomatin/prohibitin superfamily)
MNLGNNKPNPNGLDNFIDYINRGFGRLLGKKNQPIEPKETSNATFSVIILFSCAVLWLCTGFYFLAENEYGLIFINGKIVDVKHGIKVGMTLPYPFGDIEIIDGAPSKIITIGANPANAFIALDKNLIPVLITAKFNYQITNPKKLFLNHLQDQDEFENEILWNVQSQITSFIAKKDITELKITNLTVLSNEISKQLDLILDSYGITMPKFVILSIQQQNKQIIVSLPKSVSSGVKSEIVGPRNFSREVNRDRNWIGD